VAILSVEVEDAFVKAIDNTIKKTGLYSSRSEFIKDSLRKNLNENYNSAEFRKNFMSGIKKLRKISFERGYDGHTPTYEERDKIARDFLKETP